MPVLPSAKRGQGAGEIVGAVVDAALEFYAALPQLARAALLARIADRRSHLPLEGHTLFQIASWPAQQENLTRQIASALAWDHALKVAYPEAILQDVNHFFASLLLVTRVSNISRFRIVKRMWSAFYSNGRSRVPPEAAAQFEAANRAMRLKTGRDFLDCDLLHMACFGWSGDDVVVLTCDPPDVIFHRVGIYKGMVEAAATMAPTMDPMELPAIHAGLVARCEPDGEVTHLFPVQDIPTVA